MRCSPILLILALLSMLAAMAAATEVSAKEEAVMVNSIVVMRFRSEAGGLTPAQRAEIAAERLRSVDISRLTQQTQGEGVAIVSSGIRVATVFPADAIAARTTQQALANSWIQAIQAAAGITGRAVTTSASRSPVQAPGPLRSSVETINLAPGQSQSFAINGANADGIQISVSAPEIIQVTRQGNIIQVRALSPGQARIMFANADSLVVVTVLVRRMATTLPQSLTADVTGFPATADTVRGAVEGAILSGLKAEVGAAIEIGNFFAREIRPDQSLLFDVPVRVSAEASTPVQGIARVTVTNIGIQKQPEQYLWFCNNPESIRQVGPLFSSRLNSGEAVRMLYHHKNAMNTPLVVQVQAVNNSDRTARILITSGDSPPREDPTSAGAIAAEMYMKNYLKGSAEVIDIPPGQSVPLAFRRLTPQQVMSGLFSVQLVQGSANSILVRADAKGSESITTAWATSVSSSQPWRLTGPRNATYADRTPTAVSPHIYPSPFIDFMITYRAGSRERIARIGERPIPCGNGDHILRGNFGVLYNVQFRLENPLNEPKTVEMIFESSAGYGGGLFAFENTVIRTPMLQPKQQRLLRTYNLPPRSVQVVDMRTIPLSGRSYPISIILRDGGNRPGAYGSQSSE
ncbi:MAG: hypothetical protein ACK4P3_05865 [Fimbriimonadaceae bacterium]